jgi:hypothetical protein
MAWRVLLPVLLTAGSALHAQPAEPTAPLRLPVHTAYVLPNADAVRISPNRVVRPFAEPGIRLAWYAHLAARGVLEATVVLTVPAGELVPLLLTQGAERRQATVTGTGSAQRLTFAPFSVRDTGYTHWELSVDHIAAGVGVTVEALELQGPAVRGAHANTEPRRNAASVHLRYPIDSSWRVTGFYTEVTAVEDPAQTYYMATGFARGYFGMQVNSATERRIIFSVWDAAEGATAMNRSTVAEENRTQLLAQGEGVEASAFGNEGTGGHSHLVYPWKTGSVQRFFVTAAPNGTNTDYTGYWYHPEKQAWMLIASFRAPKDGLGLRRLYSFSENFGGSTGHLPRKARYGAQWVRLDDGRWRELTTATFSHDATGKAARLDRFMGVEQGQFFLSHGGFVPGYTETGTAFTRPATGSPPVIVLPR